MHKDVERFYRAYGDAVYNYLYYMTKNRQLAEDLSQETFLDIAKGLTRYKGLCSEKTWCFAIARNNFLAWVRKKKPDCVTEERLCTLENQRKDNPEEIVLQRERDDIIRLVLLSLSEEARTMLLLRDHEGLSYREIAEITGFSEANVKVKIYRAREKYKRAFLSMGGESFDL